MWRSVVDKATSWYQPCPSAGHISALGCFIRRISTLKRGKHSKNICQRTTSFSLRLFQSLRTNRVIFICTWIDYVKALAASARNLWHIGWRGGKKSFSSSKFPRHTTNSFNRSNYFSKCWWILMPGGGSQVFLKLVSPADTQKHLQSVRCNIDTALNQKKIGCSSNKRVLTNATIHFYSSIRSWCHVVPRFPLEIQIWKVQREMIILRAALLTYELWNYHWRKEKNSQGLQREFHNPECSQPRAEEL